MRASLDGQDNVSPAARALAIHATTLRYRLTQISDVSGLDLADSTTRLVVELALRTDDRQQPGPSALQ